MSTINSNLPDGSQIVTIPATNDLPWYSFVIGLSGVQYTLTFRYNVRMSRWFLEIADAEENPILTSVPLLLGQSVTGQFIGIGKTPVGDFFIVDDTNTGIPATRESFGITHTVIYRDPLAITT